MKEMIGDDMNEELILERINLYFIKKVSAHILLKNGKFYNGLIIEVGDDRWINFKDRKIGEIIIWVDDINQIETFYGDIKGGVI